MGTTEPTSDILVIGVHMRKEGYPNTLYRLADLEVSGLFRITEINVPMLSSELSSGPWLASRFLIWRILSAHLAILGRYLKGVRASTTYIPYPAVFVLFLLSFLPKACRPKRIVADAFISLYDTVVLDRKLLRTRTLLARILKYVERRAYLTADTVVVDTEQNADFLSQFFCIERKKFLSIPLSTNEEQFRYLPYSPQTGICRVLFVGTLIPLHGVAVILEATQLLASREDIHFTIIGDGQNADIVESFLCRNHPRMKWVREWRTSEQLAAAIAESDICLGIFGESDKTQRVCPLKLYAYAGIGRAIVTGSTRWEKETTGRLEYHPFATVPVNDSTALAGEIALLADNPTLRGELAKNSRRFYTEILSNSAAIKKLIACLSGT